MEEYRWKLHHWRRRRAIALYLLSKRQRAGKRTIGTCELFKVRKEQGAYHNLVQEMRLKDGKKFRNYHRMSVEDFDKLVEKVAPFVQKTYIAREPISPGEMLSATLRYLASGESMRSIAYSYRLGFSTVSTLIKTTCRALWKASSDEYLPVDGKHVRIQAPPNTGSDFYNYKQFFSVILLAVCDANYCFTVVDMGAKGRQSDGGVLHNSNFGKKLFSNSIGLPAPRQLVPAHTPLPYCFVGDAAFPFGVHLMRPYPGNYLPEKERIFNYRLSRARRTIENTFGILAAKWRILEKPIIAKLDTIEEMIGAVVCLHNFLRKSDSLKADCDKYCPSWYVDRESDAGEVVEGEWRHESRTHGLPNAGRMGGNAYCRQASSVRNAFATYFVDVAPITSQLSQ